jgi:hypothetical protein
MPSTMFWLSSLLRRTLAKKGIDLRIVKILTTLSQVKEVALSYPKRRVLPVVSYTSLPPLQQRLVEALDLKRFQATVGHTSARP